MKKKTFGSSILLIGLLVFMFSIQTVAAAPNVQWLSDQSSANVNSNGVITANIVLKNTGDQTAPDFIVEMQPGPPTYSVYVGVQSPCDSAYPQNVNAKVSGLAAGQSATVTLTTPPQTAGIYQLSLLSVSACCSSGSCQPVLPFGWGTVFKTVTSAASVSTNCGNKVCEPGENYQSCSTDCHSWCGDKICASENGETASWCQDCAGYVPAPIPGATTTNTPGTTTTTITPGTPPPALPPSDLKLTRFDTEVQAVAGDLTNVTVDIKNTGSQIGSAYIECGYYSKTTAIAQQFSLYGRSGIEDVANCNPSETFVDSGLIKELGPGEEKTFILRPTAPNADSKLADGTSNWNGFGQNYMIACGLFTKCGEGHFSGDKREFTILDKTTAAANGQPEYLIAADPLTKSEFKAATPKQIARAMCNENSDCAKRDGYEVSCIGTEDGKSMQDANLDAISELAQKTTAGTIACDTENVFRWIINTLSLSGKDVKCTTTAAAEAKIQLGSVPTGTCRASKGWSDFLTGTFNVGGYDIPYWVAIGAGLLVLILLFSSGGGKRRR